MKHLESAEQRSLVKWWTFAHRGLGVPDQRLLFAIPNGGKRGIIEAAIMKREGVRAGVPDLFLAVPHGPWPGLFIEMKREGAYATPDQTAMHKLLRDQGYRVELCKGLDEAISAIEKYLAWKEQTTCRP